MVVYCLLKKILLDRCSSAIPPPPEEFICTVRGCVRTKVEARITAQAFVSSQRRVSMP